MKPKNKKILIITVILAALAAAAYYLFKGSSSSNNNLSLNSIGGNTGNAWDKEDLALLAKYRAMPQINKHLNWLDPMFTSKWNAQPFGMDAAMMVNGIPLRSAVFYQLLSETAPNANGTFPSVHWAQGTPSLYDPNILNTFYNEFSALRAKYFTV